MSDTHPTVSRVDRRDRYEILVDGEAAGFTQYVDTEDEQRIFFHTEVDERFAGRGLAGILVSQALTDTRATGMRIVPVCPYVAKFLRTHHEFDDVVEAVTPEALTAVRSAQTA